MHPWYPGFDWSNLLSVPLCPLLLVLIFSHLFNSRYEIGGSCFHFYPLDLPIVLSYFFMIITYLLGHDLFIFSPVFFGDVTLIGRSYRIEEYYGSLYVYELAGNFFHYIPIVLYYCPLFIAGFFFHYVTYPVLPILLLVLGCTYLLLLTFYCLTVVIILFYNQLSELYYNFYRGFLFVPLFTSSLPGPAGGSYIFPFLSLPHLTSGTSFQTQSKRFI